ncbi:MAG: hypothetical protein AABX16_05205 [Nanoarchaeota archaeon]
MGAYNLLNASKETIQRGDTYFELEEGLLIESRVTKVSEIHMNYEALNGKILGSSQFSGLSGFAINRRGGTLNVIVGNIDDTKTDVLETILSERGLI